MELTAKIEREALSDGTPIYVALCLELDIASQGESVEAAKDNLIEAIELFLETASPSERERRWPTATVALSFKEPTTLFPRTSVTGSFLKEGLRAAVVGA